MCCLFCDTLCTHALFFFFFFFCISAKHKSHKAVKAEGNGGRKQNGVSLAGWDRSVFATSGQASSVSGGSSLDSSVDSDMDSSTAESEEIDIVGSPTISLSKYELVFF